MAYNNAIPQPTNLISNSQAQLLANFAFIDNGVTGSSGSGFSVDHISFSDADYPGMHYLVELPEVQTSDPTLPATASAAFYTKAVSTFGEPFFFNSNQSVGQVMWYGGTGTGAVSSSIATNGYLNLPNGLQFRWGQATLGSSNTATQVTYASAFTTGVYSIQVTSLANSASTTSVVDNTNSRTTTSFYARATNSSVTIYYFAVGH